ncbi:MAG: hypothetical protein IPQ13_14895 [Holophagaceae bacterium]|nr:hypothetical protein [Holophagaceae bacterium]
MNSLAPFLNESAHPFLRDSANPQARRVRIKTTARIDRNRFRGMVASARAIRSAKRKRSVSGH